MFFNSSDLTRDKIIFFQLDFCMNNIVSEGIVFVVDGKGLKRGMIKLKYGGEDN